MIFSLKNAHTARNLRNGCSLLQIQPSQAIFLLCCKTEMPEYRNTGENVSPASLDLPLVRRISPASALRHRPQSGTLITD
jgi:hypothetical protein